MGILSASAPSKKFACCIDRRHLGRIRRSFAWSSDRISTGEQKMVTDREKYFFDLQGFIVIRQALNAAEVTELNAALDAISRIKPGEWYGAVHGHTYGTKDGLNYQQIYEGSEPFE